VIGLAFVVVIVALPRGVTPVIVAGWRRLVPRRAAAGKREQRQSAFLRPAPARAARREAAAGGAPDAAIELHGLIRRYGSLRVLENIDVRANPGELLSLVGPNGAGKTTLIRCISDGNERTAGKVVINGHDIGRLPPQRCVRFGIGRKFQTANVFESLTVSECLRIARMRLEPPSLWRCTTALDVPEAAFQVVASTGLGDQLASEVRFLSHGMKQALELAMVLALEPSVLLLDEPTAGLTKPERKLIGDILVELAARHGLCILLIEHDLDFVRDISSRVIVLHQGRIALDGTVREVVESELVRTIYTGAAHTGLEGRP